MAKTAMELVMEARADLDVISPQQVSEEFSSGEAVLVDVRQTAEWEHVHIDGAVRAPRGALEFVADPSSPRHSEELDPSRRMITICASGGRASLAGHTLQLLGFADVAVLDGGMKAWIEAGLPVVEHEFSDL